MKLCLRCFCLWPREAVYCGRCRLPLSAKRCPKGHPNPLRSPGVTCQTCNEGPLEEGVMALSLAGVGPLLSLLLLAVAWRWAWHHPAGVATAMWRGGETVLGLLFAVPACQVHLALLRALSWYVALWLLSFLLPGTLGKSARQTLRRLPCQIARVLKGVGRMVWRLVRPPIVRAKARATAARSGDADKDPN